MFFAKRKLPLIIQKKKLLKHTIKRIDISQLKIAGTTKLYDQFFSLNLELIRYDKNEVIQKPPGITPKFPTCSLLISGIKRQDRHSFLDNMNSWNSNI